MSKFRRKVNPQIWVVMGALKIEESSIAENKPCHQDTDILPAPPFTLKYQGYQGGIFGCDVAAIALP
ncbi:hypothetical protein [Acetobacterium sp.]|uniref:hypothetical protein n=1 Tax=Acetobacterium sp. TaxID=1872094 RepID=UPI0027232881|nr:hypothetical protein [Acetobacterium sp.]MDO9491101.1 hypothetical protein [Acetobacterium sp.]